MTEKSHNFAVIPAFEPGEELLSVVGALANLKPELKIIVIDDGSQSDTAIDVFRRLGEFPNCQLLEHDQNRGKGAALKSGFKEIMKQGSTGGLVVTADADGQHLAADIIKVMEEGIRTSAAVLGVRNISMPMPLRSFVGNSITKRLMRLVLGINVTDSQSGLRAFPLTMLQRLIDTPGDGYDYEMRQLTDTPSFGQLAEVSIQKVYEPGNPTSHFHPLFDSMKIYWVLLRHSVVSLCIGALDFAILFTLVTLGINVTLSVFISRLVSSVFYFSAMRNGVFKPGAGTSVMMMKFAFNIAINLMLFQLLFETLSEHFPVTAYALVATYLSFYVFNFLFQKYFVFLPAGRNAK
jgi:glycosyltransferase involved in cell wall biosynthesis